MRISMIKSIKTALEDWLHRGLNKFPNNEEILKYSNDKDELFGIVATGGIPQTEKK